MKPNKKCELLVLGAALLLVPAASPQRLSPLAHRAVFREAVAAGVSWPRWSGDMLLSRKQLITSPDPSHNLFIYRRDGSVAARVRVWLPDAFRVWLYDAAVSGDGDLIATVGVAHSIRGEFAGFLALISPAGVVTKVVRTAPFDGRAVGFAADRSIWVLGLQTAEDRSVRKAPDHMVLHQYDSDGKLLKQLLPRSSFNCGDGHPALPQGGRAYLVSSADRIGVLTSPPCREWVELSLDGAVVGRLKLPFMPYVRDPSPLPDPTRSKLLTGVAMTRDNQMYASFSDGEGSRLFRLGRDQGVWEPVQTPGDRETPFTMLLGSEGDSLVYHSTQGQVIWGQVVW